MRVRTKGRLARALDRDTKTLQAEIAAQQKKIGHLEVLLKDTQQALEKAEGEAAKAAAGEAQAEQRVETIDHMAARLRRTNKTLIARVEELENDMAELVDKLEEAGFVETINGFERARGAQTAADKKVDDALYEGEKVAGPARQHGFEVRVAIHKTLALGVNPSHVIPTLSIGTFQFPTGVPTLDFVRKMRNETNILLTAMAATTAADPSVSSLFNARIVVFSVLSSAPCAHSALQFTWKQFTSDATTVNGITYVTVSLRLVKKTEHGEEMVGPEQSMQVARVEKPLQLSMGAVLADSSTAQGEVDAIDKRCFERSGKMLFGWRATFEEMFPDDECPHIMDPKDLSWDRLAGGGTLMSDASPQAQAMSHVIQDKVGFFLIPF